MVITVSDREYEFVFNIQEKHWWDVLRTKLCSLFHRHTNVMYNVQQLPRKVHNQILFYLEIHLIVLPIIFSFARVMEVPTGGHENLTTAHSSKNNPLPFHF